MLLEVFLIAIRNLVNGNINMYGASSPWMIIDYGLLAILLMPIADFLKKHKLPLPARAVVYMLYIYTVEYISGCLFTGAGLKIWDYSKLPYNLHGQIALYYAPFWYFLGMGAELIYPKADMCSLALAGKLKSSDIENQIQKNTHNTTKES